MDTMKLLVDLHLQGNRQGPGSAEQTRAAIALAGLVDRPRPLRIADIGCGTGASTLVLAQDLDAEIAAVDFLPEFLDELQTRAQAAGLAARINTHAVAMDSLPFAEASLDVIWSEGAIYNIGFDNGIQLWRPYLKPGGILAVSELTWLTSQRPAELDQYWQAAYPEVATAATKIKALECYGYGLVGYFTLQPECWMATYYRPLQERFAGFLAAHNFSDAAQALVAEEEREIALYQRYQDYVSYGFYIARRDEATTQTDS
jgi:SAM-dependent methyltransferase